MNFGYVRVSTAHQSAESQKSLIARYVVDRRWHVDEWIEVEMSSRKSADKRRIRELITKVTPGDTVIVSELSRLGRSTIEIFLLIDELIRQKGCRVVLIKQNLELDPSNRNDITSKVLLNTFSLAAELERDLVSERTKEGLRARQERGIVLGKPKGVIQKSIYDKDRERIMHLYDLKVPIKAIVTVHLRYGKYLSLKNYIGRQAKAVATDSAG